ncbi:YceI family protein, partial [Sphingobium amiense]
MNRVLTIAASVAAFAISLPAVGQANQDATAVQAGDYTVESTHTQVQFSVNHFGINDFYGTFPGASGSLSINPKNLAAARLDVTVPVSSVSTTNKTLDEELVSADWFDAAKFPTMHFVSTKVVKTGPKTATISGNLTLHGVTKPVTLNASFNAAAVNPLSKAYTLGFKASGRIKRTDFGVSKYAPLVSDETT